MLNAETKFLSYFDVYLNAENDRDSSLFSEGFADQKPL